MTEKKYEKAVALDMGFGEALKRFAKTDPRQLKDERKAKPKARKRAPLESETVATKPTL
jgi:hypothetical protein